MAKVEIETTDSGIAITGQSIGSKGIGVKGEGAAVGVRGDGKSWHGVVGLSESTTGGYGVYGKNTAGGTGVAGESDTWIGVYGKSNSSTGGAGVRGEGGSGPGVIGKSEKWVGVYGETEGTENEPAGVWGEHKGKGVGVKAKSKDGVGLVANSEANVAVHAETKSPANAAIAAYNLNPAGLGAAIYAKKMGNVGHAGFFEGDVFVTGRLSVQGIDVHSLLQRIEYLEQAILNSSPNTPKVPPSTKPYIEAKVESDPNGHSTLKIIGQGFRKNVTVKLESTYYDVNDQGEIMPPKLVETNGMGMFTDTQGVICPSQPGQKVRWAIKATETGDGTASAVTSAICSG